SQPSEDMHRQLVRRMVALLPDNDQTQGKRKEHLKWLVANDPASASMAYARLAVMAGNSSSDVRNWLSHVDANRIDDVRLLRQLLAVADAGTMPDLHQAVVERIPRVQPGEMANWQRWFDLLEREGDEHRLRLA